MSLGTLIYMGDYDDTYPRNDGCEVNSSLNPDLNDYAPGSDPSPRCNGAEGYSFRMNHYSWQKWIMPYIKNVDIFEHPARAKYSDQWNSNGQIMNGFALNTALTGALNTWGGDTGRGSYRNSWLGGKQTAVPNVSAAMLLFEFGHENINYAPTLVQDADSENASYTVYPPAVREWWARNLMNWDECTGWNMDEISNEADAGATVGGGVTLGMADGSAQFYQAGKFLAETPLYEEYVVGGSIPSSRTCGYSSGTFSWSATVDPNLDYPMWALTN
jgi:hypothetical protein